MNDLKIFLALDFNNRICCHEPKTGDEIYNESVKYFDWIDSLIEIFKSLAVVLENSDSK